MSVQFSSASPVSQPLQLPPPPDPQVDPQGYAQWMQTAAPHVAEPAYHPQFGQMFTGGSPVPAQDPTFSEQVFGQAPQSTTDMDLALLSQDVYNVDGATGIGAGNWSRVSDEALLAVDIDPASLSNESTGFQAAIYSDGNGRYVLAFAGTDPKSVPDWLANGGQGLGFETAQYRDAMALAQSAADSGAFGDNLVITGHSLGGGLASAASLATGNTAVTFNAAGLSDETIRSLGFTPNGAREVAADGQVRRYNVENDVLTGAQQGLSPLPDAIGHELRLENTNLIKDPIRAHLMPAVLSGLAAGNPVAVEVSPLDSALARPGEAALDLAGNAVREGGGLVVDAYGVGRDLVGDLGDAGSDLLAGRPIEAVTGLTGDVVDAGLQLGGDVVDRGLNLAGDTVQATGSLAGGLLRDLGSAVGLEGLGNTVGGWVEGGTQWVGDKLDGLGDTIEGALDTAGTWVSNALDTAGTWASERISDAGTWVAETATTAATWVGETATDAANWVGDTASNAADWAGDRFNDFKESNWNPGNWF